MPEDHRREDIAVETAFDRLAAHLSRDSEADRVRRFEANMANLRAIREELGRTLGVGAKE